MSLTNKLVVEIYERCKGNINSIHSDICRVLGKSREEIDKKSLYVKIKRNKAKIQQLKGKKNCECEHFLRSTFSVPVKVTSRAEPPSLPPPQPPPAPIDHSIQIIQLQKKVLLLKDQLKKIKSRRYEQAIQRKDRIIKNLRSKLHVSRKMKKEEKIDRKKDKEVCVLRDKSVQCNSLNVILNDLQKELDILRCEKEEEQEGCDTVKVLDFRENTRGRPFDHRIRELIYFFRTHNIGIEHVEPVVNAVLSLVNFKVKELPSKSTNAIFSNEMGILCKKQLKENFLNTENLTMHRDATTKKGRHFYGLKIATNNNIFTAGLKEVSDGKADTYVQTTLNILNEITDGQSCDILNKISSFMTDRSVTEEKVNSILMKKCRDDFNCDKDFYSFKCSVHALLQFSDQCLKEVLNFEKDVNVSFNNVSCRSKESYTFYLISCVSKLFFKDGTGDPFLTATYVKEQGFDKVPVVKVKGNRFNVLFYNAVGIFCMRKHILQYLLSTKSSLNSCTDFIVCGLQNNHILCILRALGIICNSFSEPYWSKAEELPTALSMGSVYRRVVQFLDLCIQEPFLLLSRKISLFYGPFLPTDEFEEVLYDDFYNDVTCSILKKFCVSLKTKSLSLFSPFIEETGKYFNPSEDVVNKCNSCGTNNITVERLMGRLDKKMMDTPTSSVFSVENLILFSENKTSEWLKEKTVSEKKELLGNIRKEGREVLCKNKLEKKLLFQNHLKIIRERQENVKAMKERKEEKLTKAVDSISDDGLWDTESKVDSSLQHIKKKNDKITAVKKQLNLYKTIFPLEKQHKGLTKFSEKGKLFTIEKLIENLKTIIKLKREGTQREVIPSTLVRKKIIHTWTNDEYENIEWNGEIVGYDNGIFKVQYWLDGCEKDDDVYELTEQEFYTDLKDGNLFILNSTQLDHCYTNS